MEKKWTYCAVYSIIQIHFVRGIWEETSNAQNIYVSPGSDLNLTCQAEKKGFLVQMQWSKISSKEELIAVYHPQHGYYCANVSSCDSLVAFTEAPGKVSVWTLHLRNMSSSLSGKYECTFTLYPEGIQMHTYNVLIQTPVTQDEQRGDHTIEIEINQSLEIPCFQNITSEISSEFTFTWLVEDNGTQEILISRYSGNTQHHLISNSTSFKDRVKLGTNYSLQLSPVQVYDNDLTFSCCIKVSPSKILRSFTKVKVFAKPEVPVIAENNSMGDLGKRTFTCLLNNVFPTANLTWFIDGSSPQSEKGISITTEKRKDKGGFLELRSVLTRVSDNQSAQSSNLAIWCIALIPGPGNKVSKITSEKIMFSLGSVNPPTDLPLNVTELTFSTQSSPAKSTSSASYLPTSSISLANVSSSTPEATPQTSNSNVTTQGSDYSWTSSGTDAKNFSWVPSATYSSHSSSTSLTLHEGFVDQFRYPLGDVLTNTTREFSEVPITVNVSTILSAGSEEETDGMSWPVIVAALLFFCLLVFGIAVRKWYQYQKEIMERPPPFKPPPPPIKYTYIQESTGSDLPCHEMETL